MDGTVETSTCDKLTSGLPNKKVRPSPSHDAIKFPQADMKAEFLLHQHASIGKGSHFDLKASGNGSSGAFCPKLPGFDAAHPSIVAGN